MLMKKCREFLPFVHQSTPKPTALLWAYKQFTSQQFSVSHYRFYSQVVGNSTERYSGRTSEALELEFGLAVDSRAVGRCCRSRDSFLQPLTAAAREELSQRPCPCTLGCRRSAEATGASPAPFLSPNQSRC